jgi:hypothetical protein
MIARGKFCQMMIGTSKPPSVIFAANSFHAIRRSLALGTCATGKSSPVAGAQRPLKARWHLRSHASMGADFMVSNLNRETHCARPSSTVRKTFAWMRR